MLEVYHFRNGIIRIRLLECLNIVIARQHVAALGHGSLERHNSVVHVEIDGKRSHRVTCCTLRTVRINNQNTTNNTTNTRTLSQTINVSSGAEARAIAVDTARVYGGAQ